ncbi:MAG: fluoride efflux transporter CrcB [Azospirillum sp.]|nr:fluoride efflux transporter CrcB [Azospirillum sp.]
MEYLIIALGSALGGMTRYGMSGLFEPSPWLPGMPWDTVAVNLLGSFVIGLAAGLPLLSPTRRQFLMVGFCGGFTTFSSFSLQNLTLLHSGAVLTVLINVVLSVVTCAFAAAIGYVVGEWFAPP